MKNLIKKGFISLLSFSVICPVSALTKTESVFSNLNTTENYFFKSNINYLS